MNTDSISPWEDEAKVREFAQRDPDHRLLELLPQYDAPSEIRVLDLGCAGGRNTVILADQGFDLYAVDSSKAMVEKTRQRVREIIGQDEAEKRVTVRTMDDLSEFPSEMFDLVVALGIYHNARHHDEWERSLKETARVLKPHGRLLVSNFSPRCNPAGTGLSPVDGEPNVYEGFRSRRHYFVEADELDRAMAYQGLEPDVPTETVMRKTEKGQRVTVNGLYVKRGV